MIERLVVASKNPDKIAEIERVLVATGAVREIVRGLDWDDVPETEETLEGNAMLKARSVFEATQLPSVADDTGLEVVALEGAPGVYSARFAGEHATYDDNVDKLLTELDGVQDRRARFRTAMVLARPDGTPLVAEGHLDGVIIHERRGTGGFGYDPVFEVDGATLAEMGPDRKNSISHRARAIWALAELINAETD